MNTNERTNTMSLEVWIPLKTLYSNSKVNELRIITMKFQKKTMEICNFWISLIYLLVDLSKYVPFPNSPDLARKSQNKNLILHMHFSVQL